MRGLRIKAPTKNCYLTSYTSSVYRRTKPAAACAVLQISKMKVLVLFVAVLALSAANLLAHFATANPLTDRQSCGGTTLSSECTQALVDAQHASSLFYMNTNPASLLADAYPPILDRLCSSACLGPIMRIYVCLNLVDSFARQCTRHADGTFCLVKVLQQAAAMNGTSYVPTCVNMQTNMCDTACQTAYRTTSAMLGCCGGSWFASPSSPLTNTLGRNFATCNVTLEDACSTPSSGAASIYLSTLLVVALILLSIGMLI